MDTILQPSLWTRWKILLITRFARLRQFENRLFILLALIIGALAGLVVVAFILVSERLGTSYPPSCLATS